MNIEQERASRALYIEPAAPTGSLAGMGLLKVRDKLSSNFQRKIEPSKRSFRIYLMNVPGKCLDQGDSSECVIYAADHWLRTHNTVNKGLGDAADRTRVYKEVQRDDEWLGEDYDGTSVHAMTRWLRKNGYVDRVEWAFNLGAALTHLKNSGPLMCGTDWHWDMFTTDRHGFISPTNGLVGGHAWLALGCNDNKQCPDGTTGAVRGQNSWGPSWAPELGRFWISYRSFGQLIEAWGEVACAQEIKK